MRLIFIKMSLYSQLKLLVVSPCVHLACVLKRMCACVWARVCGRVRACVSGFQFFNAFKEPL